MEPHTPEEEVRKTPSLLTFVRGGRAFLILPVLLLVGLGAGYGHYTDPGPSPTGGDFVIPHGNTRTVAHALQADGLIAPTWASIAFFRTVATLTQSQGQLHAAEFAFPAHVSMAHVLDILRHARPVSHDVTIPEGLTAKRIAATLQKAPFLIGDVPQIAEGSVFPQTLSYVRGTTRRTVVQRLQALMESKLRDVWARRDQQALDGVITSPQDMLTLASLIERETASDHERPLIARVFLNRLALGMRLQTDPSVIYGLSDGLGTLDVPLTHADLDTPGPYNSYLHDGLPPGPICSPGQASLEAAAHPAAGDMLYFVATGHGGHAFAHSLDEQNRNIRAYHEATRSPD